MSDIPITITINKAESSTEEVYTVLLYGETGVGKSTFINACDSYLKFPSLADALESSQICCRVPIKFTWQNEDYEDVIVEHGADVNENLEEIGVSSTQNLRIHYYKFQNKLYRFVDTPGFNDTRGYEAELRNVKNMLKTIATHFSGIHALCILLKPSETRETLQFKYGILQFLSIFHRNISKNVIFLYTHSKTSDYKLSATNLILKNIFDQKNVCIPCNQNNVFLLDNDGFRYLLAVKLHKDSADAQDTYKEDWYKSANTCFQLLEYIRTLDFRLTEDTLRLNKSRFNLENLFYDQMLKLQEELDELEKQQCKYNLEEERSDNCIERLKKSIYDTVVTVREGRYHLICTDGLCKKRDVYSSNGKACCPNCGSWAKIFCAAFINGICRYCGCSKDHHEYIDQIGFKEKEKKKNTEIEKLITKEQNLLNVFRQEKEKLTTLMSGIRRNKIDIYKSIDRELQFLRDNSILIYHKECMDYIQMEIDVCKEKDKKKRLEAHLKRYEKIYNLVKER